MRATIISHKARVMRGLPYDCGCCRPPSKFHQEGSGLQTPVDYSTEHATALAEETNSQYGCHEPSADFTTEIVAPYYFSLTGASCLRCSRLPLPAPAESGILTSNQCQLLWLCAGKVPVRTPALDPHHCACAHGEPLQLRRNANSEAFPHSCW